MEHSPAAAADFPVPPLPPSAMENAVMRKVALRLIPFIGLIYTFNILDRTNIGIASLTMNKDLNFSNAIFGLGVGMFFIGYFFFEVPSNLILERVGARKWIARIMFTWGAVSAAMMFVRTPMQFYVMRFLLGVAEAGFYPGMILYLTYWFPAVHRARAVARFVAFSGVVGVLGVLISGFLLKFDGIGGLHGWQWLFLLEGVPSCLIGFLVLSYMTDRPEVAHWLAPQERDWLTKRLAGERVHRDKHHGFTIMQALASPRILHFCAIFFLHTSAGYGLGSFVPLIFKQQTSWNNQTIALAAALPGLVSAASMLLGAAHSDRTCERKFHVAVGFAVGSLGICLMALSGNAYLTIAALMLFNLGVGSIQGPFWSMPTSMLSGAAAAGGIAFINSVGNLGGYAGPVLMGKMRDATHDFSTGLFTLSGMLLCASALALFAHHSPALERAAAAQANLAEAEESGENVLAAAAR